MFKTIKVIINPASGASQSVLKPLNTAFRAANVRWDVAITHEAGDGRRLARQAVAEGVEAVGVCGGDGTVSEVASGLIGSDVPLAIFPGGTANVTSVALGIPSTIAEASALACSDAACFRTLDMGRVGDHYFLLQASIGFVAAMVAGADRKAKDRMGPLAYMLSALQALQETRVARYTLTLDEKTIEVEGVTCIVANSGNFGVPGLSLSPLIDEEDGLLDVMVVRRSNLGALMAVVNKIAGRDEVRRPDPLQPDWDAARSDVHHWQARSIGIATTPAQMVQSDGEMLGETPVQVNVIPRAVRIIVPKAL